MAEQVGNPFRILYVCLEPRNLLDVLCVGHHNLQGSFQNRVNWLPVHSRALHGHVRAAFREQPFAQLQQLSCSRVERSHLLLDFPVLQSDQQAGHHGGLMHIKSTTAFYQCLHDTSLTEAIAAPQVCCRHCHASFPFPGATKSGTFTGAGQSAQRDLCHHRVSRPPSNRSPTMLVLRTDPSPIALPEPHFSCLVVRRRRMRSALSFATQEECSPARGTCTFSVHKQLFCEYECSHDANLACHAN